MKKLGMFCLVVFLMMSVFLLFVNMEVLATNFPPVKVDKNGNPTNFIEVGPKVEYAYQILPAGKIFVWIAPVKKTQGWKQWDWKRYGPFEIHKESYYIVDNNGYFKKTSYYSPNKLGSNAGVKFINKSSDKWYGVVFQVLP